MTPKGEAIRDRIIRVVSMGSGVAPDLEATVLWVGHASLTNIKVTLVGSFIPFFS